MAAAKQIAHFKEVPLRVRVVILFLLGLVPVNCLLTFGADAVPSLGVLEAAVFACIATVLLLSVLLLIFKGNVLRVAAYVGALVLTFLWIVELYVHYWGYYSHTISVSVWIFLLTVAYIVRIDIIYRLKAKLLDYLHIQFRVDSIVIIVSIAFYIYSYTIQHRASVIPKQIAVICFACIVLWAFALWQLENRIAEGQKLPSLSFAGVPLLLLAVVIIEVPAFLLLNEVKVLLNPINVPELPPLHLKRPIPVQLPKDKHGMSAVFSHTFLIVLFICVVAGLIVYFIMSRKKETDSSQRDSLDPGMMNTIQRQKLSHRRKNFVQITHPVRKQVQKWLKRIERRGTKIVQSGTIRSIASQNGNDEITKVLGTYEQVRYDPSHNETDQR